MEALVPMKWPVEISGVANEMVEWGPWRWLVTRWYGERDGVEMGDGRWE